MSDDMLADRLRKLMSYYESRQNELWNTYGKTGNVSYSTQEAKDRAARSLAAVAFALDGMYANRKAAERLLYERGHKSRGFSLALLRFGMRI